MKRYSLQDRRTEAGLKEAIDAFQKAAGNHT